jgi:hypothetical protein
MSETGSSALDLRLTKARDLIVRGKQRPALNELWEAEALARGNADALREILDFVAASSFGGSVGATGGWRQPLSRESAELAELLATLEQDAKQAAIMTSAAESAGHWWPRERWWPPGLPGALLAIFVLGVLGVAVGVVIGLVTTAPCNSQDFICFSPGETAFIFAIVFGLGGAGLGIVGSLLWVLGRKAARHWSCADS